VYGSAERPVRFYHFGLLDLHGVAYAAYVGQIGEASLSTSRADSALADLGVNYCLKRKADLSGLCIPRGTDL
jgi:hypothetical protein